MHISPPSNPFTVIRCMDQLSVGLCHLAEREIPSSNYYDDNHKLRLIVNQVTFAGVTDNAFDVIRKYGRLHASVIIRLLEIIANVAQRTRHQKQRTVLLDHVQAIECDSREIAFDQRDQKKIEGRYQAAVKALEQ
ncbi:MAG: hypothetical protein BRC48_07370 [Cyanobacteria bacterium QS_9_48_30]|nr:MAG: hypothetical protein BRC48_07370 [Cyanobacteria bacterium QS_9_48_30]